MIPRITHLVRGAPVLLALCIVLSSTSSCSTCNDGKPCTPTGMTPVPTPVPTPTPPQPTPTPTPTSTPVATPTATPVPTPTPPQATPTPTPTSTPVATPTATPVPTPTPCVYAIVIQPRSFPAVGGNGGFSIETNKPTCTWTSISNASWIRITSGASGTGNGATNYIVDPNAGGPRTATITSAGKLFTIAQEGR